MTIAQASNGSQACTISTEHNLASLTTGKTSVLNLDLNVLAVGDVLDILAYEKTLSGSTERILWVVTVGGVQAEPVFQSIPVPCVHAGSFRIKQTAGTGRTIDWSVWTLD